MSQHRSLGREEKKEDKRLVFGKNHLLAIGIDEYQHCPKLKNAVKDATDMMDVLKNKYGFLGEDISFVTNAEATETRILYEFRNLIQKVKPEDNVMIFFSGHGYFDEVFEQGYWIPVNAHQGALEDYIPNSVIHNTIRKINSRHTFMIADACFSGSFFGESRSMVSKKEPSAYHRKVGSMNSRWGLASGRNEIVADGAPGENSPFTENLVYYLDNNTSSPFTVSELVQHVKRSTANNSEQTPIGSPLRNVGDKGGEFIFFPEGTRELILEEEKSQSQITGPPKHFYASPYPSEALTGSPGPMGKQIISWIKTHPRTLSLIALSAIFWGMWSTPLYLVIPILTLAIIGISAFLNLQGPGKLIATAALCIIVTVEFIRNQWSKFSDEGKLVEDFWGSLIERTQNHEFLWAALGFACFSGFLYYFFKGKEK